MVPSNAWQVVGKVTMKRDEEETTEEMLKQFLTSKLKVPELFQGTFNWQN